MRYFARGACLLAVLAAIAGCDIGVEEVPSAASPEHQRSRAAAVVARGDLHFVEGYGPGQAEALRAGKPMMVFFTARWCEFCRQMSAEAFTDPRVVKLARNFVCVLVDADAEPDVCRQFAVTGYPTVQFVSPRGVPLDRVVGKRPGSELTAAMQEALRHVARRDDDQSSGWW